MSTHSRIFLCIAFVFTCQILLAQNTTPKLVVGIVVDQMRNEYLYRFSEKYGQGGFRKLLSDGYVCRNAHFNYVPTVTGPGHASVYAGTTPSIHGIIGNDWYDRNSDRMVNCVFDSLYKPVGVKNGNGDVSPSRLLTTTVTDELRLAYQQKSKVIAMSIKDRGAVLPGGHLANAAYWYDNQTGKFMTSTYYTEKLPEWVNGFNQMKRADQFLSQVWDTQYPIDQYTESGPDNVPYEEILKGKKHPVFPYKLSEMRKEWSYELLSHTPFSNDLLTAFAKAAIDGEGLGNDLIPDFLAISYSATDIIGHSFGPQSKEIEDTYVRLDKNLEELLTYLDIQIGKDGYLLFLTADHGVCDVSRFLQDSKVPSGYFDYGKMKSELMAFMQPYFPGKPIIQNISNDQVFFNSGYFLNNPKSSGVDLLVAAELTAQFLLATKGVATVFSESVLRQLNSNEPGIRGMVARGFNPRRSGDLAFVLQPGWYSGVERSTTHGSGYSYDTHVPMIFYGFGVKQGTNVNYHPVTDIAPTLSALLNIPFPSGATGQPIKELFE